MARSPKSAPRDPFTPVDRKLLSLLADQNVVLRSTLCAFARLGVAWRIMEPDRTRAWLGQLEPHPIYKGAQFLFDLLEVEDFMLDGPPPPPISDVELAAAAARIAALIGIEMPILSMPAIIDALPDLEPGFFLYRDVLLGVAYVLVSAAQQV